MDEKIGQGGFLERGVEGLDELVRELAHKTDSIGEEKRLFVRQGDLARRGVEGGEKFVLHENIRAGEAAEERRFADIGVTDNGGIRHRRALAVLALGGAGAAHVFQFALQAVDLEPDLALVLLELAFAFAFRADPAALLAEMAPGSR